MRPGGRPGTLNSLRWVGRIRGADAVPGIHYAAARPRALRAKLNWAGVFRDWCEFGDSGLAADDACRHAADDNAWGHIFDDDGIRGDDCIVTDRHATH